MIYETTSAMLGDPRRAQFDNKNEIKEPLERATSETSCFQQIILSCLSFSFLGKKFVMYVDTQV